MRSSFSLTEFLVGLVLSILVSAIGYKRGALNGIGVVGAPVTGILIFGLGGWEWGVLLITFFASSSALSFYRAHEKLDLAEKFAKGHRRDLGQVLANAGLAALLSVLSQIRPHRLWFFACAGAMAAANADTWATEIGVLSSRSPRLITTGKRVETGTSGGITCLGLGASLGGALFIGLAGVLTSLVLHQGRVVAGTLLLSTAAGGFVGSLVDSLLGSTIQAVYWCEACGKETERRRHRCGVETRRLRGWDWIGNDWVNTVASAMGALFSALVGLALV